MIGLCLLLVWFGSLGAPRASASAGAPDSAAVARSATDSLSRAAPAPAIVLPEVRIDRERRLREARRRLPTAFVSDLSLDRPASALPTLDEALESAAGVRVVQYGGLGAFSTVSIRGAPPGQVAVYLDGVPLTSAAHGIVNLADLPVTAVERIEVYRGLAPLALGAATPGGAINLVTVAAPELRRAGAAWGSFGTGQGSGSLGARRGRVSILLHGGWEGSRGDFPFLDDNGTAAEPADDVVSRRANNRFDAATALATLEIAAGRLGRVRLREDWFRKRQGVPGLGVNQALATRLAFERSITTLELERAGSRLLPALRIGAALQRERSRFRDLDLELGLGRHDTDDRAASESASLGLEWSRLPLGAVLQAGGSLRIERARLADRADGVADPPESRRRGSGASLGLQLRPAGEWLTLHAARRWDRIADRLQSLGVAGTQVRSEVERELDSPQLGVRIALPRGAELLANWSEAERAPDFMELFGNQGAVLGNPRLLPERGENRDFGAAWSGARGAVAGAIEWARFECRTRDLILYVRNSPSTVRALNVSRARVRGDEVAFRFRLPGGLSGASALTWSTSADEGSVPAWRGRRLPQRPERQAHARLEWAHGPLIVAGDLHHLGENFLDRYNLHRAASRTLAGASMSLQVRRGLRLALEGKNLGDRRVSDVGGFPLPGRSVFVSCRARLGPAAPAVP